LPACQICSRVRPYLKEHTITESRIDPAVRQATAAG